MYMKTITLIFTHQLFEDITSFDKSEIYLIEHPYFFRHYTYHKKKIMFHRASMKAYQAYLETNTCTVYYIEHDAVNLEALFQQADVIQWIDVAHAPIDQELTHLAHRYHKKTIILPSPAFLTRKDELIEYFEQHPYFMHTFYKQQRIKHGILITKNNKPYGNKWSYDTQNRKKLTDYALIHPMYQPHEDRFVQEARLWTIEHFADNPGSIDNFFYPTNHRAAQEWLNDFLTHRFSLFGPYQDAIVDNELLLFHSLLSPLLNSGLLTPSHVLNATLSYAESNTVPLQSLEGFVRQLIGWREYVYGVYITAGEKQTKSNFFNHTRSIPGSFWHATTGVEPIDVTIQKALDHAYAHHIERLMILGNFMLLCEFNPHDVYRWFMELFIDAYDWVMVPNVYGMSQYADGGLITTKPYISSSNYILTMSNYKKGDWCAMWDALYWHFIHKHRKVLASQGRMGLILNQLARKTQSEINTYKKRAETFLERL